MDLQWTLAQSLAEISQDIGWIVDKQKRIERFWEKYNEDLIPISKEIEGEILSCVFLCENTTDIIDILKKPIGKLDDDIIPEIRKVLGLLNGKDCEVNLLQYLSRIIVVSAHFPLLNNHKLPVPPIPESLKQSLVEKLGKRYNIRIQFQNGTISLLLFKSRTFRDEYNKEINVWTKFLVPESEKSPKQEPSLQN